jgi:hypothetical protein
LLNCEGDQGFDAGLVGGISVRKAVEKEAFFLIQFDPEALPEKFDPATTCATSLGGVRTELLEVRGKDPSESARIRR